MDAFAFQIFVFIVFTIIFSILVELDWLTILDLLRIMISWKIKVLDHVQLSNSCYVVEAVLLTQLI